MSGGRIGIHVQPGQCIIENTAAPMEDGKLLHAFDLFYTGDKSRSRKDGHMGMGLFLAHRILKLHNMRLTLTAAGDRVRAEIAPERA